MTNPDVDFRQSLVAAVQAELQRHHSAVIAEVERLRKEGIEDRASLRKELQGQIASLAHVVEQIQGQVAAETERVHGQFEQRLVESESRQTRRLEDMTAGIEQTVQSAARPLLVSVKEDHERMGAKVDSLESQLRKFDEQAARMVTYFNDLSHKIEARSVELAEAVKLDTSTQIEGLKRLVDENESNVRRFQNEVGQQVTGRLNSVEDRFNTRLMSAESRMKEDAGAKIADIQAHVGRVNNHIDETLAVVNNRLAAVDERFVQTVRRIDEVEESVKGVDRNALDEMAAKMSAAVGEAMLVRIEMERFEKSSNERADKMAVRLTEVETQVQDATMDVSTAVQLDRLEEIERALIELDPRKFVLKEELNESATAAEEGSEAASLPSFAPPPPPA